MNLFFRLIALLIRNAISRERIDYLDTAVLRFRVWITDQDAFMHMNNSRYNSICDLSGIDLMTKIGVLGPMRKAGYAPVIVYRGVTLHRMLKFPEAYDVRTRVSGWTGAYVCFAHDFYRGDRLCAEAVSIGRAVGKGADKPTIQGILEKLGLDDAPRSPDLTAFCKTKIEELEAARAERRALRKAKADAA